jgi:hydroxyacylglutathione hydrolase
MATERSPMLSWGQGPANVHLLRGRRDVLVDTGGARGADALMRRLRRNGVEPHELGAVVLTHGHADHAGAAAAFAALGVPVVLGAGDLRIARRGRNPALLATGPAGRMLNRVLDHDYPPFEPSVVVRDRCDLGQFGLDGEIRVIGGHTDGSLVVVTGDVVAVGDLVRGGYLGGSVFPRRANVHYFSPDPARDLANVIGLLDAERPARLALGHGGPLDASTARRRLEHLANRLRRP